jgi:hypothetical protein
MSITNGKESRATPGHPVKALVVIACRERDEVSRSLVGIVTGMESMHVARGPWSSRDRHVITIIATVPCLETTMKSLELASYNGASFYLALKPDNAAEWMEAWSNGDGQVYGVGVDCDNELPSLLSNCRDEVGAIAAAGPLADVFAKMADAFPRIRQAPVPASTVGGA